MDIDPSKVEARFERLAVKVDLTPLWKFLSDQEINHHNDHAQDKGDARVYI